MVKSWDCFDTLVARLYQHPHSVWAAVGDRLGIQDYVQLRRQAEIEHPDTLMGACKVLSRMVSLSPDVLFKVEVEEEHRHCFPIVENLQQVQDGDLVVSDMYLPAHVIESILQKCGLKAQIQLHATNGGKANGWIWDKLPEFELHIGDNLHSDVHSAIAKGLDAQHYDNHRLMPWEETLADYAPNLGYFARYVRLQNPYPASKPQWFLWNEQAWYNLPLLLLASHALRDRHSDRPIAFALRDGIHWQPLYESLFPQSHSCTFDSSRKLYQEAAPGYRDYLCRALGQDLPRWVIADIQGTGRSAALFFARALQVNPTQFFCCSDRAPALVPHGYVSDGTVNWDAVERFNCANYGSALAWGNGAPIRAACEYPAHYLEAQHGAMQLAIAATHLFPIPFLKNEAPVLAKQICAQMSVSSTAALMPHHVEH